MGNFRKTTPHKCFTKLPNDLIRNTEISDSTFRLICWISSHSEGFNISFNSIKSQLGYGRDKMRAIITEGEKNDYLVRIKTRNDKGQIDWDYFVFAEQEECREFKRTLPPEDKPEVVDPSVGQPSVDEPTTEQPVYGTAVGGLEPPLKKIQFKEEQIKEEQEREEPPTPKVEVLAPKPINPETQESALEQIGFPGNQNPKSSQPTDNPSLGQKSPAPLANAETIADRVRRTYQETGNLPRIPAELEAWVQIDLGSEIVASYRKSGRITTIKQGDIQPDFARYVSAQNKGKDIDYGYSYIRSLEKDPTRWETLAALVIKWQASGGNDALNITKEISKQNQPDYSWLLNARI
jgi:hypothetical protein